MRNDLTEIVFLIDASGSMYDLTDDTIGGFNAFLEKQKNEAGSANLTTVLFNRDIKVLHDRADIHTIQPITKEDYYAGGTTALLDAMGTMIDRIGFKLSETPEAERPGHVLFVITTDGLENASTIYTKSRVKEMVEHQRNKYSWEFLFIGANINAIGEAAQYGIDTAKAANYSPTSIGTKMLYETISTTTAAYRSSGTVDAAWSSKLSGGTD